MRNIVRSIAWFSPAFNGLPLRERSRLLRLAGSGRAIEDPDDARVVCAFIRQQLAPTTRGEWVEAIVLLVVFGILIVVAARSMVGGSLGSR
jgi:hypothetical protein